MSSSYQNRSSDCVCDEEHGVVDHWCLGHRLNYCDVRIHHCYDFGGVRLNPLQSSKLFVRYC